MVMLRAPAWAAGASERWSSIPRARPCPATAPARCRSLTRRSASTAWRRSGRAQRSRRFVARRGWRSRVAAAPIAAAIGGAVAAGRSRSPGARPRPIRPAASRPTTRKSSRCDARPRASARVVPCSFGHPTRSADMPIKGPFTAIQFFLRTPVMIAALLSIGSPACRSADRARARATADSASSSELSEATPRDPLRPEPPAGRTIRNHPSPPDREPPKLDSLRMPAGFSIELYTDDVPHARSLARGPAGVVFVSTRRDNRVYAVIDADGDRRVDEVRTIACDLDTPNGIAYRDGDLYVAQIDRILRFAQIDERLADPPAPELVSDALPSLHHHGWRYIRFGPDGLLYIAIGAPCDNCLRDEPIFASIARMRHEGGELEVYASGVRNTLGFDWHPETGELWFTENGRDELGNDIPPDELNRAARAGQHFGYPHCHGGVILDPEYGEGRSCAEFTVPERNLDPHVAALGMRFYTGTMFPARYRNAVIIAEH